MEALSEGVSSYQDSLEGKDEMDGWQKVGKNGWSVGRKINSFTLNSSTKATLELNAPDFIVHFIENKITQTQ